MNIFRQQVAMTFLATGENMNEVNIAEGVKLAKLYPFDKSLFERVNEIIYARVKLNKKMPEDNEATIFYAFRRLLVSQWEEFYIDFADSHSQRTAEFNFIQRGMNIKIILAKVG